MISDAFPALGFGLICGCFIAAAGWLFLQVIQKEMEGRQAAAFYAPLFFCWIIIGSTFNGPLAWVATLSGCLAVGWCIFVPFYVIRLNDALRRDLNERQEREWVDWLQKHPETVNTRFQLGDYYRREGRLRDALEQYSAIVALQPDNRHAVSEVREVSALLESRGYSVPTFAPPPVAPPPPSPQESPVLHEIQALLSGSPADAGLLARLGEELLHLGRVTEAADAFRKALWVDPDDEALRQRLEEVSAAGV